MTSGLIAGTDRGSWGDVEPKGRVALRRPGLSLVVAVGGGRGDAERLIVLEGVVVEINFENRRSPFSSLSTRRPIGNPAGVKSTGKYSSPPHSTRQSSRRSVNPPAAPAAFRCPGAPSSASLTASCHHRGNLRRGLDARSAGKNHHVVADRAITRSFAARCMGAVQQS